MLKNIVKQTTGAAGGFNGNLRGFPCTHILVTKDRSYVAGDKIIVSLSTPGQPTQTLVPGLPLLALQGISNIEYGMDNELQAKWNALTEVTSDFASFPVVIPVGNLRNMETDSTIEIQFIAGEAATYSIAAAFVALGQGDELFVYVQSNQTQGAFGRCTDIFVYNSADVLIPSTTDFQATVGCDFGSGTCLMDDLSAFSYALGDAALVYNPNTFRLFQDPFTECPGTVTYQMSGAAVATSVLIARTVLVDAERVSKGNIAVREIMEKRQRLMSVSESRGYRRSLRGMKPAEHALVARQQNVKR